MKPVPLYRGMIRGICASGGWPAPEFEVRVSPTRRWRFDVAWPARKLALEVNGGVWVGGRHSRGTGQIRDFEKLNAAQLAGWTVLQVTPQQVADGTVTALLDQAFGDIARYEQH